MIARILPSVSLVPVGAAPRIDHERHRQVSCLFHHGDDLRNDGIDTLLADLEDKLSRADIIDVSKLKGDQVMFGATVTLIDEDTEESVCYQIVGEDEADIREGRVSFTSPVARALIGRRQGEDVTVRTPAGERDYEILEVRYE